MAPPTWNHSLLRVKNAEEAAAWYVKHLGFSVVARDEFAGHRVVYAATLPAGEAAPASVLSTDHVMLAFRSEKADEEAKEAPAFRSGNVQPERGFGHVAVLVDDVYATCAQLEKAGVAFQKKPDEGNMKGLAFALDSTGYWVEIIARGEGHKLAGASNLSQTMIRVKDADKSLGFYTGKLGMTCVAAKHFPQWKFSLYFLASLPDAAKAGLPETESEEAFEYMKRLHEPILELTHNHDSDEVYVTEPPADALSFTRLGFLVDSVAETGLDLVPADKVPASVGGEDGAVFARDPDGYYVSLRARA